MPKFVADSAETTGLKWAAIGTATSYTPTLTNMSKGNGTVTASYVQVGKLVLVNFLFTLGSTSTISTSPQFSLPVTAAGGQNQLDIGIVRFLDAGVAFYIGVARCNSTTTVLFETQGSAGTYVNTGNVTATTPFTWTTNDEIFTTLYYQAA